MSDFRDARLKMALESAPDEAARPSDAVRETILRKARSAAAEAKPCKPVRRWFDLGLPWSSALASLLVVGFVTVLWKTQEPPPEVVQLQAPLPPAARPASAAAEMARVDAERKEATHKRAPAAPPATPPAAPSKVAQPPVELAVIETPRVSSPAPAPAYAPAPAPATVQAPAPMASRLAAAPIAEGRARAAAVDWTELRVLLQAGDSVRWERSQLPEATVALLQSVFTASPVQGKRDATAEEPELRVQLRRGDQLLGWLELGKTEARWISTGGVIIVTRPERLPELIDALRSH